MNKEFAWFLGYLLSDGCITRPKYRSKGDETHLQFICQYKDREILHKVKNIIQTRANVCDYPHYKSPHSKLRVYDKKDIIEKYNNIKSSIPSDIIGYERHFIRGLIDGDGCLYYRASRDSFVIQFIDEKQEITDWVIQTICCKLNLSIKPAHYNANDHIWTCSWEGNIARLIAWWIYHGNVDHCSLQRKLDKYRLCVLQNHISDNEDINILNATKAYIDENNEIAFKVPGLQTLDWAHRLQHVLSFNTIPVFHNKGKRKYYHLYVPNHDLIANMRDILSQIA